MALRMFFSVASFLISQLGAWMQRLTVPASLASCLFKVLSHLVCPQAKPLEITHFQAKRFLSFRLLQEFGRAHGILRIINHKQPKAQ